MARSKRIGRPSGYSDEIADRICQGLSEGRSLRDICGDTDMPSQSMVFRWLSDEERSSFRERYARAREAQADAIFDEILHIADTPLMGERVKVDEAGKEEITREDMLGHRRLQIDARRWMAGKLAPKKYGDKVQHTGADGEGPVQVEHSAAAREVEQRLKRLEGKSE